MEMEECVLRYLKVLNGKTNVDIKDLENDLIKILKNTGHEALKNPALLFDDVINRLVYEHEIRNNPNTSRNGLLDIFHIYRKPMADEEAWSLVCKLDKSEDTFLQQVYKFLFKMEENTQLSKIQENDDLKDLVAQETRANIRRISSDKTDPKLGNTSNEPSNTVDINKYDVLSKNVITCKDVRLPRILVIENELSCDKDIVEEFFVCNKLYRLLGTVYQSSSENWITIIRKTNLLYKNTTNGVVMVHEKDIFSENGEERRWKMVFYEDVT